MSQPLTSQIFYTPVLNYTPTTALSCGLLVKNSSDNLSGSGLPHDAKKSGKWTPEEDNLLRENVQVYGEKQWRKISQHIPGRSSIQCLHRWSKILRPGLTKGPWTSEEDAKLILWVETEGISNWAQAARFIKGRSSKQCRERWFNNLSPDVKKSEWTKEEDELLFSLYLKYGSTWSKIAKFVPGRTENSIKNRFYSTFRKINADREKSKEGPTSSKRSRRTKEQMPDSDDAHQPPHTLYKLLTEHFYHSEDVQKLNQEPLANKILADTSPKDEKDKPNFTIEKLEIPNQSSTLMSAPLRKDYPNLVLQNQNNNFKQYLESLQKHSSTTQVNLSERLLMPAPSQTSNTRENFHLKKTEANCFSNFTQMPMANISIQNSQTWQKSYEPNLASLKIPPELFSRSIGSINPRFELAASNNVSSFHPNNMTSLRNLSLLSQRHQQQALSFLDHLQAKKEISQESQSTRTNTSDHDQRFNYMLQQEMRKKEMLKAMSNSLSKIQNIQQGYFNNVPKGFRDDMAQSFGPVKTEANVYEEMNYFGNLYHNMKGQLLNLESTLKEISQRGNEINTSKPIVLSINDSAAGSNDKKGSLSFNSGSLFRKKEADSIQKKVKLE